ncbi:TetR/AcrR family transcriptional regulator [Patulibacter sp.]|uniref:TetR/AcrR family transcriptional regulator n=1 Tax=Patulibacter sp. TaxID=1912859 RepID=UPI00271A16F6|nr:TetR/AcrR family transcriptional regulator [Patulibacter sp.]MDO9408532.1 TetR/AcrR family transcriptional regulator [Patulibacter sp.]
MVNSAPSGVGVPAEPGLRERKKQRTRETIARAALELFDRDGFHETTIPAIAAAADVSPRTVSAYFPAKEDLVFPDQQDSFARLAERLGARADGETTADALRAWIGTELPRWKERDDELQVQRRVVASDDGLKAVEQGFRAHGEELIATAIAEDLGASPDALEPRMAAAATFAIFGIVGDEHDGKEQLAGAYCEGEPVVLQLLDRALRFVDAGIRSLRDDAPAPV